MIGNGNDSDGNNDNYYDWENATKTHDGGATYSAVDTIPGGEDENQLLTHQENENINVNHEYINTP